MKSLLLRVLDYVETVSNLMAIGNALSAGRITPAQASYAASRVSAPRDVASTDVVASTALRRGDALPAGQYN